MKNTKPRLSQKHNNCSCYLLRKTAELETKSKSQNKQTFLHFDQVNFKEQVVSSFLPADIPLHKLNYPSLKSLFARMGKVLPSETAARACFAKLASQKEKQIQELLRDKTIF